MSLPGKDVQVNVQRVNASGASQSWNEATTEEASPSFESDLLETTRYGDDGTRNIKGLEDASIDITLETDPSNSDYTELQTAADTNSTVNVEYVVNRDASGGSQTIYSFTGRVSTFEPGGSVDDKQTTDVTIENSDGNAWSVTNSGTSSV